MDGGFLMWSDRKSLALSRCCVVLFMALLLVCAVFAPWVFSEWLLQLTEIGKALFLFTVYTGFVPAAALLICLFVLLRRISRGRVFVRENVDCLRYISWCCFAGSAISFVSSLYLFPWFAIGVAAGFMGIIVRVIKNVFGKAVSLQDDADHTV